MGGRPAARTGIAKGAVILDFADATVFTVDDLHCLPTSEITGRDTRMTVLRGAGIQSFGVRPELDE
jgi:hypothetical protein